MSRPKANFRLDKSQQIDVIKNDANHHVGCASKTIRWKIQDVIVLLTEYSSRKF